MDSDGSFVMLAPPKPWPRGMRLDACEWSEFLDIMARYRLKKNVDKSDQSTQVEHKEMRENGTQTEKVEMKSVATEIQTPDAYDVGWVSNVETQTMPSKLRHAELPIGHPKRPSRELKKQDNGVRLNMNVVRPLQKTLPDNGHQSAPVSKYASDGRTFPAVCSKSKSLDDNQKIPNNEGSVRIQLREGSNSRRVSFEDNERRTVSVESLEGSRHRTAVDADKKQNLEIMEFVHHLRKRLKSVIQYHIHENPSRILPFISKCTEHSFNCVEQIISGQKLGGIKKNDRKMEEQWEKNPFWIHPKKENKHDASVPRSSSSTQDETYNVINGHMVRDDLSDGEVHSSGRSSEGKEDTSAEVKMKHPSTKPLIRRSYSNEDTGSNPKVRRTRSPQHKKYRTSHSNTLRRDSKPRRHGYRSPEERILAHHPRQEPRHHRHHHLLTKQRSNSPRTPPMPSILFRSPPRDPRIQPRSRERSRDFSTTRVQSPPRKIFRDVQLRDDFRHQASDFQFDLRGSNPLRTNGDGGYQYQSIPTNAEDEYQYMSSYLPNSDLSQFPYNASRF